MGVLRSRFALLALAFMVALGATATAGFLFVRSSAEKALDDSARTALAADMQWLNGLYASGGLDAVTGAVQSRTRANADLGAFYLVTNPAGAVTAGSFDAWPGPAPNTARPIASALLVEADSIDVIEAALRFKQGGVVLVAREIALPKSALGSAVQAGLLALGGVTLIGMVGAAVIARAAARRLESINAVCRAVEAGNLSARIATDTSDDSLGRLTGHINAMLTRVDALVEGLRNATQRVAHELRTPLARLKARLEQVSDDPGGRPSPALEAALAETDSILRLFEALLELSSVQSSPAGRQTRPVPLKALTEDVAALYDAFAEEHRVQLVLTLPYERVVVGDRELLFRLIANLIDNAIKYSPADDVVSVTLAAVGGSAILDVADHGPGIPADLREKMFEPFARGPNVTGPGYGLGLSLARAIAVRHGYTLTIEPAAKGTLLRLRMPLGG